MLPWLLSTLAATHAGAAHAAEIQQAANDIAADSPAYMTALYYRVRLLLEQGDQDAARKLLDLNMSRIRAGSSSDKNSFSPIIPSKTDLTPEFGVSALPRRVIAAIRLGGGPV